MRPIAAAILFVLPENCHPNRNFPRSKRGTLLALRVKELSRRAPGSLLVSISQLLQAVHKSFFDAFFLLRR